MWSFSRDLRGLYIRNHGVIEFELHLSVFDDNFCYFLSQFLAEKHVRNRLFLFLSSDHVLLVQLSDFLGLSSIWALHGSTTRERFTTLRRCRFMFFIFYFLFPKTASMTARNKHMGGILFVILFLQIRDIINIPSCWLKRRYQYWQKLIR